MFELIPDVRQAMAATRYLHLDEHELTVHLKAAIERATSATAPRVYWNKELTTNAKYQRALGDDPAAALWWRDGRTWTAEGRELMYIHFHKLKEHMTAVNFGPADLPRAFSISRRGFIA